jgi:hypothetical protein
MATDKDIIEEGYALLERIEKVADAYEVADTMEHDSLVCAIIACGLDNILGKTTERVMKGKSKGEKQEYILSLFNRIAAGLLQASANRYAMTLSERLSSFADLVQSVEEETARKRKAHN